MSAWPSVVITGVARRFPLDVVDLPAGPRWADAAKYLNDAARAAIAAAAECLKSAGLAEPAEGTGLAGLPPGGGGLVLGSGVAGAEELGSDSRAGLYHRLARAFAAERARPGARGLVEFLYDEVPDFSYVRGIPSLVGQFIVGLLPGGSALAESSVAVFGESDPGGLGALEAAIRLIDSGELDRVLVVSVAPPRSPDAQTALAECGVPTPVAAAAVAVLIERAEAAAERAAPVLARLDGVATRCCAPLDQAIEGSVRAVISAAAPATGTPAPAAGESGPGGERAGAAGGEGSGTTVECDGLVSLVRAVDQLASKREPVLITQRGFGPGCASAGAALISRVEPSIAPRTRARPRDVEVVVTGLGVVTPIGASVDAFWDSVLTGRSGLRTETRMDLFCLPGGHVAGLIDDQSRAAVLARSWATGRTWCDTLLHDAVDQALADAGIDRSETAGGEHERPVGLVWSRVWPGPTGSDPQDYANAFARLGATGGLPAGYSPEILDRTPFPAEVARRLNAPLIASRVEATCAGGLRAIIEAARLIRLGKVDVAVVCASVSRNTPYVISQYAQLMALSRWRGAPELASMPFDRRRSGMVLNESSGALVLESAEHAAARGAAAYASVAGWGLALTTDHVTAPRVAAVERVMTEALARAGRSPRDVDALNAHGTSTKLNDLVEAHALHQLLGARASQLPVYAIKSLTGHGSAASGVVESVAAVRSLVEGVVPPVVTCVEPDPACDVTTLLQPLSTTIDTVVKNSFGFGGQYASVVFTRPAHPSVPIRQHQRRIDCEGTDERHS